MGVVIVIRVKSQFQQPRFGRSLQTNLAVDRGERGVDVSRWAKTNDHVSVYEGRGRCSAGLAKAIQKIGAPAMAPGGCRGWYLVREFHSILWLYLYKQCIGIHHLLG